MTVILDPGNDVGFSYSDAARRAWRDTSGLWRTDRDLWKGRSDQAWGPSRVWNSGAAWETQYGTEYANARNSVNAVNGYNTPGYTTGELWSTSASRWQQQWLSDYTARYNAGVTAGDASGRAAVLPAGSGGNPDVLQINGSGTTMAPTRTGVWQVIATCQVGMQWEVSPSFTVSIDGVGTVINPTADSGGTEWVSVTGGANSGMGGSWRGIIGPGNIIRLTAGASGAVSGLVCYAIFVPTPSYPH